ncbi:hypothetical protein OROMI_023170 [Orobanche minor]
MLMSWYTASWDKLSSPIIDPSLLLLRFPFNTLSIYRTFSAICISFAYNVTSKYLRCYRRKSSLFSCLMLLCVAFGAAVSSAKNARRRAAYASINEEKRASMLLARRGAFAKRAVCPGMCRDERLQSKRERPKYRTQNSLLKRLESISTHAWCLPPVDDCRLCGAVRYLRESKGFCCLHGQVSLALPQMPLELWNLYISTTSPAAVHFRKRCRTYNNTTAFSSLGITYDHTLAQSNKGIYTLRVQGAVYHFIRSLIPHEGQGRQLQLYFYDTEHEMHNRLSQSGNLDMHILEDIVEMMKLNPYASFFRSLRELPNLKDYTIVLRADPCLDMRIYSMPTTHQVAAIWNELTDVPIDHPHDIRVCTSAGKTYRLHYYYGCYDPLQYPLLFPYGESGWHTRIEKLNPLDIGHEVRRYTRCAGHQAISLDKEHCGESILAQELQNLQANRWKRNNVAAREFYCYLFQIRANDATNILRAGRLVQQYQIDCYIKIETQRLDYFRSEQVQHDLRIESFEGIIKSMACDGNLSGEKIGQKFVLPSSYIGSPRDMQRRYLNALALVSEYGKPDFFITVTCNPNWPEIREGLLPGEEAQNRSDLVARIFRARNEEFKNEIVTRKLLAQMEPKIYALNDITPDIKNWTARVCVVNKTGPRISSQANPIKFQKLLLADEQAMLYRSDVDLLKNSLQSDETYLISNALVQPVKQGFENPLVNNKYQWIIGARTVVLPTEKKDFVFSALTPVFTHYNQFHKFIGTRGLISTVAVIFSKHDQRCVSSRGRENTLREYVAIDEAFTPFIITFWNDAVPEDTYSMLDCVHNQHVIAALNFTVTKFHGLAKSIG